MEIRRIQVSDVPDFIHLWEKVYAEGIYLAKGPPPADRVLFIVKRVVREQIPNFVAVDEGRVIGAVEVFPGTMCGKSFEGADRFGYLGIQVALHQRRKGIARALMQEAIHDSVRYGYKAINLMVFETNRTAIHLYDTMGFTVTGEGSCTTLPAGVTTKGQHMTLELVHNK